MIQEQPGGAAGRVPGGLVAGGLPVLVQSPGWGQRLVEGGAPPGGGRVAVPPAVGPLPGDQGSGQGADPRVGGQAEPAAGGQGVSLNRGVGAGEPADLPGAPARHCQPGQDVTGGGDRAWLVRGNGQFGQGYQPPVRPGPLAVGVHAEPAVASLAGQQRGHLGAGEHLAGVVTGVLAGQVAAGHQPDGRLAAVQQPGHGGVRPRVHARPSQAALTRFTIRRSRGSPVWRFRQAM